MSRKEALERGKQEADKWYENYCNGFKNGNQLSKFTTEQLQNELDTRTNYHTAREIKTLRVGLGLTLEEFGGMLKPPASKSNVSSWEKGSCLPNRKRMKQIKKLALDGHPG